MPKDHCFDIVSKVNLQELRNAMQQAQKELATRFDFQGTSAGIVFEESPLSVQLTADHHGQLQSVREVVTSKLSKRGVALKAFEWKPPESLPSGGMKQQAAVRQGIAGEHAKEITKAIKASGLKVQPRIDGDSVRVSGRQIDDLQAAVQMLKTKDFGLPIQVENYR